MTVIDLSVLENRAAAVAGGYIWSAPEGAIVHALKDIAAGTIPPPNYIPNEYAALAEEYGVKPAEQGGLAEGQGPV